MTLAKNENPINLRHTNRIKSFGHSMYPILHNEDIVFYRQKPFADLRINDIIVTRNGNRYTTHRIIFKAENHLITKGDNNREIDSPVYPEAVIGVVYKVKRGNTVFFPETYYLLQSSIYFEHIKAVLKEVDKQGINYVLLKGLPLHLKYRHEHPQRKFFDFDILVSYKDRNKLLKKLQEMGFQTRYDYLSKTHEKLMDKPIEETCIKRIDGFVIAVDVHYEAVFMMTQIGTLNQLYHQHYIERFTESLFRNTISYKAHSFRCNLLRDDYLLVYLALHFFHHSFKGLFRLTLIESVIASIPLRKRKEFWKRVAAIVKEYRLQGYIYGTFMSMAKYLEKITIPEWFLESIAPDKRQNEYLKRYFNSEHIYEEYGPTRSGILLFRNIYALSYNPWYIKIFTFLKPAVIFMMIWLVYYAITKELQKIYHTRL